MKEQEGIEQATMSIGAVERMTGINANTLRMWERRYQLGPSKRSPRGQREYTVTDVDHLRLLKKLIDNGMRIGDIAQLPTKTLSSLLIDTSDDNTHTINDLIEPINTQVVGMNICHYFKSHIKRYPKLTIACSEMEGEEWLINHKLVDNTLSDKQLLILQQSSLNKKHIGQLKKISAKKIHIIVLYLYSSQEIITTLKQEGIILILGTINLAIIYFA